TELTRLLEHGDLALAAPVQATHRHDVRGRNVVARLQVERALPRIGQSVEVVDLLPAQAMGEAAAHLGQSGARVPTWSMRTFHSRPCFDRPTALRQSSPVA